MEKTGSKPQYQPKTMAQMAEILPGFSGLLTLSEQKPPRRTIAHATPSTSVKHYQPKRIAELLKDIKGLRECFQKPVEPLPTIKKKPWITSTKPIKSVNNTANGQLKQHGVKKKLHFQHNTQVQGGTSSHSTHNLNAVTPKFHMPLSKPKKSSVSSARNIVRISGIDNILKTPIESNKPMKSKVSFIANKENLPKCLNENRNTLQAPISMPMKLQSPKRIHTRLLTTISETPASNVSWKFDSNDSFLQKESEVKAIEEKNNLIKDDQTLENIAKVSLPISTPFMEYRNKVSDFFNNSGEMDISGAGNDDTIMCFERSSTAGETVMRDESVSSLCNLLKNVTVNNTKLKTETNNLEEQEIYNDIERIENAIKTLSNVKKTLHTMKETRLKTLQYIKAQKATNKLNEITETNFKTETLQTTPLPVSNKLNEKDDNNRTLTETNVKTNIVQRSSLSVCRTSVIKSPSYKIPKKNLSLARKVHHKSMPSLGTPGKCNDKALTMYMKMKEQMNFLNTPVSKDRLNEPCDTPATTSRNLQMQLDKLFNDN